MVASIMIKSFFFFFSHSLCFEENEKESNNQLERENGQP